MSLPKLISSLRISFFFFLILLTALLSVSCLGSLPGGKSVSGLLSYESGDICASVSYKVGSVPVSARVTIGGGNDSSDGNCMRTFNAVFTEPPALAGVRICRTGEAVTVSLGGMELPADSERMYGILLPFTIFSLSGSCEVVSAGISDIGGEKYTEIILSDGQDSYTVCIAKGSALPSFIRAPLAGGTVTVEISP